MRRMMVQHALLQANHVLSTAGNITADTQTPSARHSIAAPATVKNNQTHHTPTQSLVNQRKAMRSTTMYTTRACSMDSNVAEAKRKKKLPERGQSFLDKKGSSTDENSHDKEKQVKFERERETERKGQRQRHTERERDRQTDRQTERKTKRQTYRVIYLCIYTGVFRMYC